MQNQITDLKAFLEGFKPAFLYNHNKPKLWFYTDSEIKQLIEYPYVDGIHANLPDQTLYFQNTAIRNKFIFETPNIKPNTPEYHEVLGIRLGYPPKAAAFYAYQYSKAHESESVGVQFNGIGFVGAARDVEEYVSWLWTMYPAHWFERRAVEISHLKQWYQIEYKNHDQLKMISDQIKEKAPAI